MKFFQKNAFGWYILVVKTKKEAEQIEKILGENHV